MLLLKKLSLPLSRAMVVPVVLTAFALSAYGASAATIESRLAAKRAKAAQVRTALDRARTDLAANMAQYQLLSKQLDQTRQDIVVTQGKLDQIEGMLTNDQGQLAGFVVHAYESNGLDGLAVVLGTSSFEDFLTRVDFLSIIGKHQASLITEVKISRAQAQALRDTLQKRDAQLIDLRSKADAERVAIQGDMVRMQGLLVSLGADIAKLVREQEQARLASMHSGGWDHNATGASWMLKPSLLPGAYGTLDSRPGELYRIPKGVATRYKSDNMSYDWVASWYGNAENGTGTSSGRPYNQEELTCANLALPLGTLLAVSNGSRHVMVVITDHGPYIAGRSLDLSHAAAVELGIDGVGQVHAEVVEPAP